MEVNFFTVLLNAIREHVPELMLFLAVGLGYWLGKTIRLGKVQLGGVAGTLIAALVIGQLGFDINPNVKNLFFALFIFALGYAGGPQFFANLNLKSLRLGLLSLIEVVMVFTLVMGAVYIFDFDVGTAAGIVAGAATESAVIGTASEAIARLDIGQEEVQLLQSNIATAYSITYLFGVLAIVLFTSQLAPMLLSVDLKTEAEKLWLKLGGLAAEDDEFGESIATAAYEVTLAAGKNIAQIYELLGTRVRIEKLLRAEKEVETSPEQVLQQGDLGLIIGEPLQVAKAKTVLGSESSDYQKLNFVVGHEEVVLSNPLFLGQTFATLQKDLKYSEILPSVYLSGVKRAGHWLPLTPNLQLAAGDILRLYGKPAAIDKAAFLVGKPIKQTEKTNLVLTSAGIVAGILVGSLGWQTSGIFVTLGTGGGVLVIGLLWGWYQAKHPYIPGIPPSSVELMKDLGLALFIACIGLSAGPAAIKLIKEYGLILPLVGLGVTILPALVSLVVGRYLLKIELPILLGAIAGQQCSTPAVSAVQAAAGNSTPVIGYTITYALSNVLLPLLGPILVGTITLLK